MRVETEGPTRRAIFVANRGERNAVLKLITAVDGRGRPYLRVGDSRDNFLGSIDGAELKRLATEILSELARKPTRRRRP